MTEEFQQGIRQWVQLDNKLKEVNAKARELREQRNSIQDNIIEQSIEQGFDNATIQISNGKLKIGETRNRAPLSFKFVEQCLLDCIDDTEQVKYLMNYIKEKQPYRISKDIKRFWNKE